ncbi:hypothetical protein [Thalassobacillus sp. CUG 92003]|uniref:hypothetical protein n=1 Tax=Thalassobacillus sp. CUG 92003 TaxID=2736641 RepID=UPI0015E6A509|nr:hypothetical protein [Thalassobacillus sp. CUG 92003]
MTQTNVRKTNLSRQDFANLLRYLSSPEEPDFAEVEEIAERNGFYFAADGVLWEHGEDVR